MTTTPTLADYSDGEVFKPGERWLSPRGTPYYVELSMIGGKASLRRLPSNWAGLDNWPLSYRSWDATNGWTLYESALPPSC